MVARILESLDEFSKNLDSRLSLTEAVIEVLLGNSVKVYELQILLLNIIL